MNYFGRILEPEHISPAEAGAMIKASLTRIYAEGRFLGGFEHRQGALTYVDASEGGLEFFTGREQITRDGRVVYELLYHGGLVNET